ncbi:MAG TPA: 6,7-dimethyl-8-ribityllumazine synthase [Euzebya sp.]|nr:6,7-dimethyl-8-ribityllumazine synthase [Euzebya sp.]
MRVHEGSLDGQGLRIAIIASRFNDTVVQRLVDGARSCLTRHGVADDAIDLYWVPGAWEIPLVARKLALGGGVDAIVALGLVVRGQTAHFEYVAGESAAVGRVALDSGVPIAFGVLTTETWEQATDRSGGKMGNKGWEAAQAALETANLLKSI